MSTPVKNTSSGVKIGTQATHKVGFCGATPVAQRSGLTQAVATDLASALVLVNELRAALVAVGLIKGGI